MAKRIQIQLYNVKTGESLTLPLNPESTDLENAKDIKTYNILGFGEVSIKGSNILQRINLSNLLPDDKTYWATLASLIIGLKYRPYSMRESIDMLNRWVDNDALIRVIISDRLNKLFRVERYVDKVRESVNDSGYNIDLVEYRNPTDTNIYGSKTSKIAKLKARTIDKYIPSSKVMQAGTTIYKLAKLTYGGNSLALAKANAIYNRNADLTGKVIEMLPI